MPNNIRNDLTITAPKATLQKIADFMRSEESAFDFDKLIPMPDAMKDMHSGCTTINGKQYRLWRTIGGVDVGVEDEEIRALTAKHGASNWYDWSITNWGTKWNAYSVDEPVITSRTLRYGFDTAWSSPEPIIQALADKFGVTVRVKVSGETYDGRRYSYTKEPDKVFA